MNGSQHFGVATLWYLLVVISLDAILILKVLNFTSLDAQR